MRSCSVPMHRFLEALRENRDEALEAAAAELTAADEQDLMELAGSDELDQRWWAIRALAHVGGKTATSLLVDMLHDEDAGCRAAAALALGHIYVRDPDTVRAVVPRLAPLLGDDEGFVRQVAADALSMCGDDAVVPLTEVLQREHDGARTRAAIALGKIGTMKAAAILYQHLNDPNYLVRTYAYEALDEMGLLENMLFKP